VNTIGPQVTQLAGDSSPIDVAFGRTRNGGAKKKVYMREKIIHSIGAPWQSG
jgi:hypothetical protein